MVNQNVKKSFGKVRADIENLQHQILELKQKVEDMQKVIFKKEKRISKRRKK